MGLHHGGRYALDNLNCVNYFVGSWPRFILYVERIHSYFACYRANYNFDSHNSGSTNSLSQFKIQGRQVACDQRQSVQDGARRMAEAAIHVAQEPLPL